MRQGRQARILVVDDDARSRRLLRNLLEPMGCLVEEATGGSAALIRLNEGAWDTVLLDLNMPDLGGYEVLERIRRIHPMEDLPVILVTGQDDPESRSHGLALRANEFLAKPVDQNELLARVGMMLAYRFARLDLEDRIKELEKAQRAKQVLMDAILKHAPVPLALDALDLCRLEDGTLTPRLGMVAVPDLAAARVEAHQPRALACDVRLTCGLGTTTRPALADVRLLGRILDHMIADAVAATPPGGRVDVFLAMEEEDRHVRLEIQDGGDGTTAPTVDPYCRTAAAAMGATLIPTCHPGRGGQITLVLPVAASSHPSEPTAARSLTPTR